MSYFNYAERPRQNSNCGACGASTQSRSTLAGFEATIGFIDDVNPSLAAHDAVVAMAGTQ
jgi:hypothetical protein